MEEFRGKVAVVTGGASGIGRALAERCAREGMKVVLADIEQAALDRAAEAIGKTGAAVLAVRTDVSQASEVQALADKTLAEFGGVHLLFNNAGVGGGVKSVWENTLADWQWVLGVNLWSVIHGVRIFTPIMLKENTECYIVNTASIAGLIAGSGLGVYKVSKHGVVSLSETLAADLQEIKAQIHVAVLCPAWVQTRIVESERNRPANLQDAQAPAYGPQEIAAAQSVMRAVQGGIPAAQVADQVFEAMRANRFYILTHPESRAWVEARMQGIMRETG
ncbi:MAG: SDR family NAD(P)-dependent oxidoreductase [Anaerolineae bacterium]